jgi:hypothetical protein
MYGLATEQQTTKIQRIQNIVLRTVFKGKTLTTKEMHLKAIVETLEIHRQEHLLSLMYGRTKQQQYIDIPNRCTRQGMAPLLKVPIPTTNKMTRSPCYAGSVLWNGLSPNVRHAPTKFDLKNSLKATRCGVSRE